MFKLFFIRMRMKNASKAIKRLDRAMVRAHVPRWKRRQMWRDFIKSEAGRNNACEMLKDAGA